MTKLEKIREIREAVEAALENFSPNNVDIIVEEGEDDEQEAFISIMYHSRHNSFPIIDYVCSVEGLTDRDIEKIADEYNIGWVW
jgi:hypothetical protein